MTLVEKLICLPIYQVILSLLEEKEEARLFCRHDFDHFWRVARIGKYLAKKHHLQVTDDEIFLSAFLHDIGRITTSEMEHGEVSAILAEPLLDAIDCPAEIAKSVLNAVKEHHFQGKKPPQNLVQLLSLADNLSRQCYSCEAAEECYWSDERKNHHPFCKEIT